jgi:hypothetical protein
MASGFYYNTTDLLDLSAKCDSNMVGSYGTTLNAKNFCPDTTNLVKYTTSVLNGCWGNVLATYCDYFKVGTSNTGIAKRGCAPVPKRYSNGSHMNQTTITATYEGDTVTFRKSSSGNIQYQIRRNSGDLVSGADPGWTTLPASHMVIDVIAGGGGGSGGNTGTNLGGHSRGGSGGGAGAWCSYLIDTTKFGSSEYLTVTLGKGGSGGGTEGNGTKGGSSTITFAGTTIATCTGGSGAAGSNYWDGVGPAGGGGGRSCTSKATKGIVLLASDYGADGGGGASVNSGHAAGTQGKHGPSSISFGGLLNFTNVGCYGGSSAKAASYNYSNLDERCAIGGGGGASMLANGGHGGGSMNTYNTVYSYAGSGTYGSGGGGGYGGKSGKGGGNGGPGTLRIYYE